MQQDDAASDVEARLNSTRRRITLLEKPEIVRQLTPELLAAIQTELMECRAEFEEKTLRILAEAKRDVNEILRMAAQERLSSEAQRINSWEQGTSTSSADDNVESVEA